MTDTSNSTLASSLSLARNGELPSSVKEVHLVFLVHGLWGNSLEMGYIQTSLESQAKDFLSGGNEAALVVHSIRSNEGKTSDGVISGGSRMADEINSAIADISKHHDKITLSFVGNSLGGLYARYAVSEICMEKVTPKVFCTTATPHLGIRNHTYIPLPGFGQYLSSLVLQQTGRDLFSYTNIIERLATGEEFLKPLSRFEKRIAFANSYNTDFQVPTATAAFLSESDESVHYRVEKSNYNASFAPLVVETRKQPYYLDNTSTDLALRLDALGWTKVFCDVREHLVSLVKPFAADSEPLPNGKDKFTSAELLQTFATGTSRWHAPFGHTVLVANSKDAFYEKMNAAGRPIMDRLAANLLRDILGDSIPQGTTGHTPKTLLVGTFPDDQGGQE
jgi:hypothetical protein